MARDRSFGGKAGTWLRKKRKLSTGAGSKATLASTTTSVTNTKNLRCSTSTASEVIGWDDVRGRPIYFSPTVDTTGTSSSGNDSSDSEVLEPASPVVRKLPYTEEKSVKPQTRKQRSYGGTRRSRVRADPDDFDDVKVISSEPLSLYGSEENLSETKATDTLDFDEESAVKQASPRRVSMTGNVQENSQLFTSSSSLSVRSNTSSVFDFHEDDSLTPKDSSNNNSDECKTPKGGRVSVVSSKTSLSAAKLFFKTLDREHNLVIATESNSPTPNRRRRRTTATRRRIGRSSSNDPQWTQEYTDYRAACEASSVSPLPLLEVTTEMYDGFLDE